MHKHGLIETLHHRSFRLCSSYENFHREIEILKSIFKYIIPKTSWINVLKSFWINHSSIKILISWFLKGHGNSYLTKLTLVLPYLGQLSLDLRTRLRRTIEREWPSCKLKVIFKSKRRLNTLFLFKNSLEKKICSGLIYRHMCINCKVTYYGKTFRQFYTRAAEHVGTSNLTGKRLKNVKQSAISDHLL